MENARLTCNRCAGATRLTYNERGVVSSHS
jgi:hypothetical protein